MTNFSIFYYYLDQHISSINSVVRVQLAQRRIRNNDNNNRGGFNNRGLFYNKRISFLYHYIINLKVIVVVEITGIIIIPVQVEIIVGIIAEVVVVAVFEVNFAKENLII